MPESLCVSYNSLSFKQSCNINRKSINTCSHIPKLSLCKKNRRQDEEEKVQLFHFHIHVWLERLLFQSELPSLQVQQQLFGNRGDTALKFPFQQSQCTDNCPALCTAPLLYEVIKNLSPREFQDTTVSHTPALPDKCKPRHTDLCPESSARDLQACLLELFCTERRQTQNLKHYFKHHQLLRSPGESTPKAGTQCSRNGFYFRKLNCATSKSRETTFSHFLMWTKSDQVGSWSVGYSQLEFIPGLSPKATELIIG